jgi:hypothetical protein
MNQQLIISALSALRHTGSVFGLLLTKGHDVIYQDSGLPEAKIAELASILDDIAYYFEQEKRSPDQLAFGYDGGNLLLQLRGDLRMVVFHHQTDEVDFLAGASAAFLKDYEMGVLLSGWAGERTAAPEPVVV